MTSILSICDLFEVPDIRKSLFTVIITVISGLFLNSNWMSTQKSSPSAPSPNNQHHRLISYLDQFGKQISSRKHNNHTLEEQLSSLSRGYNQAQEKLLQTERTLLQESILIEKQRTVIEIYKHIIRESMQDEGIISFIQSLEEDEAKKDIYDELQQIKVILNKKRVTSYKKSIEEDRTLKELKKQISKLYEQRSSICDESEVLNSENQDLKSKLEETFKEKERLKGDNHKVLNQSQRMEHQLKMCQRQLEMARDQLRNKNQKLQCFVKKEQEMTILRLELQDLTTLLSQKLSISLDSNKENMKNSQSFNSNRHFLTTLDSKLTQLIKYKAQYKKIKETQQNNQFIRKELPILKLFLSEEALTLVKEFEEQRMECLEGELRNLAVIEKNKIMRLQDCEKEVWKYKLQLMRDEDNFNMPNVYLTQSLRPNLLASMQSALQSFRHQTHAAVKLMSSMEERDSVSEFVSQQ